MALDLQDEDSIHEVLCEVDFAIQWGENVEPDDKMYDSVEQKLFEQQFQKLDM